MKKNRIAILMPFESSKRQEGPNYTEGALKILKEIGKEEQIPLVEQVFNCAAGYCGVVAYMICFGEQLAVLFSFPEDQDYAEIFKKSMQDFGSEIKIC